MKKLNAHDVITKLLIYALIGGMVVILGHLCPSALRADSSEKSPVPFQKGMCYVAWDKDRYSTPYSDQSLEALAETGTEWVSIITTWYQKSANSTSIAATERTPSDESLKHAIRKAHELKLKVLLKPHVDLIEIADGAWRGDIFLYTPADWDTWFQQYLTFITHFAALAEESGADLFCVGTELAGTVGETGRWKEVIREVRKIYTGEITYAANWDDEFSKILFWNELDYAGIDAYFPLSEKNSPQFADLKEGWGQWIEKIEKWAKPIGKPIIFTEVGYSSTSAAAVKPWEEKSPGGADLKIQADCYRALFEAVWGKQWIAGIYWWRWNASPFAGGPNNKGYTPQNKPAQEILTEWYKK